MNKLYIFCGIPFAGKTTIAKKLAEKLGFVTIDLDDVKFEIFGKDIQDLDLNKNDWDRVYEKMYQQIESGLKEGKDVIHDTGNFTKNERLLVKNIADKLGLESIEVFIDTPVEVAKERLRENTKTNERFSITEEEFESACGEMEPPEGDQVIMYKYPESVDEWIATNF